MLNFVLNLLTFLASFSSRFSISPFLFLSPQPAFPLSRFSPCSSVPASVNYDNNDCDANVCFLSSSSAVTSAKWNPPVVAYNTYLRLRSFCCLASTSICANLTSTSTHLPFPSTWIPVRRYAMRFVTIRYVPAFVFASMASSSLSSWRFSPVLLHHRLAVRPRPWSYPPGFASNLPSLGVSPSSSVRRHLANHSLVIALKKIQAMHE